MPNCSVATCISNNRTTTRTSIKYHQFPRDAALGKEWVLACRRKGELKIDTARVCSNHFKEDDYERDLAAELMGTAPKRKLKSTAVPSQNLDSCSTSLAPSPAPFRRILGSIE